MLAKRVSESNSLDTLSVEEAWTSIEAFLNEKLCTIKEEIRHYPAPIPACDAQFNYLLEQRSHLPQEIARVQGFKHSALQTEARNILHTFIATCPYLDEVQLSRYVER